MCSLLKRNAEYHVTYNMDSARVMLTLWRGRITIVAAETQQCILCVVELHVTAMYMYILSVAQQCF